MNADPSRHVFTGAAVARLRAVLGDRWDGDGATVAAAARRGDGDAMAPRSLEDYVRAVSGLLAAGGTRADVVAFLRDEEAALFGAARTPPRELGSIGREAWLAARGLADEEPGVEDD